MAYQGMTAEHIWVEGHNGDAINAYLARPLGAGPFGAVMLFHHMPGWDEASKEMARKFAHNGYIAIMPNLHYRQGHDDPVANSNSIREAGGMPDDRTLGDAEGAIGYLRHLSNYNGKVGIIGFCSGGRQVFLAACKLKGLSAAVDCWGGGVTPRDSEPPTAAMPHAPIEFVNDLSCPLLGIFGEDDARPSVDEVKATDAAIQAAGKSWEYEIYPNAGHGFVAVDRPSYAVEASNAAWPRIFQFYAQHLS